MSSCLQYYNGYAAICFLYFCLLNDVSLLNTYALADNNKLVKVFVKNCLIT